MDEDLNKRRRLSSQLRSKRYRERQRVNLNVETSGPEDYSDQESNSQLNVDEVNNEQLYTSTSERNDNEELDFDNNPQQLNCETVNANITLPHEGVFEDRGDEESTDESDPNLSSDSEYETSAPPSTSNEESDEEEDSENDVEQLRQWVTTSQISHQKIDDLLLILRKRAFPQLPRTAKTFLKTASAVYDIQSLSNSSEFVYFGIESQLKNIVETSLHSDLKLELIFNVDGIPLFKSSSKQFWPILCQLYHPSVSYRPFPVAIYAGYSKPNDLNQYLQQFVTEMNQLQTDGVSIDDKIFKISIKAFICDRPARAFIKAIKNHGAYFACERCKVKGVRIENRTVYLKMNRRLRTHQTFCSQQNPRHHTGVSPLVNLNNCNMVNMFLLDFMHLACLGIMKKLFTDYWINNKSAKKLGYREKSLLSQQLLSIKSQIPDEFQRTTRDIVDISKWKATEYRFVLLYAGPVILKSCLTREMYDHFLLFSIACRILSSDLAIHCNDHAKSFLRDFVDIAKSIYGDASIVLNMLSLIHLADDAKYLNAPISKFTAFPFESLLGKIKKLLRNGNKPLAQVCRRLHEASLVDNKIVRILDTEILKQKKESDESGEILIQKLRYKGVTLTVKEPDNIVLMQNGYILQLKKIYTTAENDTIKIEGIRLKKLKPMLEYPCNSEMLQMWKVSGSVDASGQERRVKYDLTFIELKMVLLSIDNENNITKQYTMPLLHMI